MRRDLEKRKQAEPEALVQLSIGDTDFQRTRQGWFSCLPAVPGHFYEGGVHLASLDGTVTAGEPDPVLPFCSAHIVWLLRSHFNS